MADVEYPIKYTSDVSQAVAGIDQLIAKLTTLDALVDKLKPKLKTIAEGVSAPVNTAGRAVDRLNASLTATSSTASKAGTALKAVATDAAATSAATKTATSDVGGLGESFAGLSAATVAVMPVRAAMHALVEATEDARQHSIEVAEAQLKLNEAIREMRAIMGDKTTTKEASDKVKDLMLETGATQQEATGFQTMWESALPAARQSGHWQLNDADTEKVKGQALAYAIANGISPETIGRLVPSIGIAQDVKTPEDALSMLSGMQAMGVEAVGKFTPLMKAEQKLVGQMVRPEGGGAFKSTAELMAGISSLTGTGIPEAQTVQATRQLWRMVSAPMNEQTAETFKKYGLDPGKDDLVTSLEKLAPLLDDAKARGLPETMALRNAGFTTSPAANLTLINAIRSRKIFREKQDSVNEKSDPKRIAATIERFNDQNPNRIAEAQKAVAELDRGAESLDREVARKFAYAGLERRHEINTQGANLAEWMDDLASLGGLAGEKGRPARLDRAIVANLETALPGYRKKYAAQLQGVLTPAQISGDDRSTPAIEGDDLSRLLNALSPEDRRKFYQRMREYGQTTEPLRAPGNPLGGPDDSVPARRAPAAIVVPVPGPGAGPAAALGGAAGPGGAAPVKPPGVAMTDALIKQLVDETKRTNMILTAAITAPPRPGSAEAVILPGRA